MALSREEGNAVDIAKGLQDMNLLITGQDGGVPITSSATGDCQARLINSAFLANT